MNREMKDQKDVVDNDIKYCYLVCLIEFTKKQMLVDKNIYSVKISLLKNIKAIQQVIINMFYCYL